MKKFNFLFIITVCVFGLLTDVSTAALPSPRETFKFGLHMNKQGYMNADAKRLAEIFMKELEKSTGFKGKVEYFSEISGIEKAVASQSLDFWLNVGNASEKLWNQTSYDPIVAATLFGTTKHSACVYVSHNSTAKQVSDLKKKRAQVLDANFAYYQLREVIGGLPPETYFNPIKFTASGQSALFALSLGQTDLALVMQFNVPMMKLLNPGPLKKIKELFCTKPIFPTPPVFIKKSIPLKTRQELLKLFYDVQKKPEFSRFALMMNRLGMKWVKVDKKDYLPSLEFLNRARNKGWDKDYLRTRAY